MLLPPADGATARRSVHLRLGTASALTTTTLDFAGAVPLVEVAAGFGSVRISSSGTGRWTLENGIVRILDLEPGARVVISGRVDYRTAPHGLCRWTDPADDNAYVVGSGALGGAAHFLACGDGPADRMATDLTVEGPGLVRGARSPVADGARPSGLASHHLGLVAGPWQRRAAGGVELLSRAALDRTADLAVLAADSRRALEWLLEWFGTDEGRAPWGTTYTQVLLPEPPWLAMEHPGCVLLSERLLDAPQGQRVSVLAHEAAHQWLGNLVSPLTWSDVGTFEGLAELLGQLACEAIVGASAAGDLVRRRSKDSLALPPIGVDLRTIATTAGLAEVAGPVQHAELFRVVRSEVGADAFRERVRSFVGAHEDTACAATDLWTTLGLARRWPRTVRLPALTSPEAGWQTSLSRLRDCDPATAAAAARRAFLARPGGRRRVHQALAALTDPATPYPVIAGLAAELSRTRK